MMRIKLFGLFIAFALLALVRPRKCLELLEAADAGTAAMADPMIAHRLKKLAKAQECPLPPAGWRCTRRAGHDGPCAAVVK